MNSVFRLLCVLLTGWTTNTYATPDTLMPAASHPGLLLTNDHVNTIKKDIERGTWKKKAFLSLQKCADEFVEEKLEIPKRGGNWQQFYVNPTTYNDLKPGKQIGDWRWEHVDPLTGQIFLGDSSINTKDYDGVVIDLIHNDWAMGVLQLGLAWQLSGQKKYAEKAKNILLGYAALYPSLPTRNKRGTDTVFLSGRLHGQDLDEARWLVDMIQGADMIWKTIPKQEQQLITDSLFLPMARHIVAAASRGLSNVVCWRNAAIGLTGLFTNDQQLIQYALADTSYGFTAQITKGFSKEGMIMDLSPSYHYFSLYPLIMLAQAIQNYGYPADLAPMKRLFTAPLTLSSSYMLLPPLNDSRAMNIRANAYLYEWAYSQFTDSSFAWMLKQYNRSACSNISTLFTGLGLIFGKTNLPESPATPVFNQPVHYPHAGLTKLVTGTGHDNLTCFVKYPGKRTSGHAHYAQLDFALLKGNEYISVIPENYNYASPLSLGYYKTSMAHNTFVLNEQDQLPSAGKCLSSGTDNDISYGMFQTTTNDSLHFVRTIALLNKDLVLVADAFQIERFTDTTVFDIAYHQAGTWLQKPKGKKWTPPHHKNGYPYLKEATITKQQTTFSLTTTLSSQQPVTVSGMSTIPADIITAYGPPFMGKDVPTSLFRFRKPQGMLAYCISLTGQPMQVQAESLTPTTYRITIHPGNGQGSPISVTIHPNKGVLDIKK